MCTSARKIIKIFNITFSSDNIDPLCCVLVFIEIVHNQLSVISISFLNNRVSYRFVKINFQNLIYCKQHIKHHPI